MADSACRPRLHLSPPAGWMSDPNGLIRHEGLWHVFYQHDPESVRHGPMHWGHAASADLVSWEHRPVAFGPDRAGHCWSGSAVRTREGQVKIFYTAHRKAGNGRDDQHQCLVHAELGTGRFARDPSNPVLCNSGEEVFRDPKVIWHEATASWIMLLTRGQEIAFYGSPDLRHWAFRSSFGAGQGFHSAGPWECPDLVEVRSPCGHHSWALIVSVASGAPGGGSGVQYFLGSFDGAEFRNANAAGTVLWLDHGRDFYAAQTFFDPAGTTPLLLAWAGNWQYAQDVPGKCRRGAMSLPRYLSLSLGGGGPRLVQRIPETLRNAFPEIAPGDEGTNAGTYRFRTALQPDLALRLFGAGRPQFSVCGQGRRLQVHREDQRAGSAPEFASDYAVDLPAGDLEAEVFVDRGMVEMALDGGSIWITAREFPEEPEAPVCLAPEPGDCSAR